jgi:DNA-binding MurR/RpiR family transcriptional regulator
LRINVVKEHGAGPPPATLQDLREHLDAAVSGRGDARIGRRSAQVLEGMLAAPRQAAVFSISELGAAFGVHPSTLTRLAKALGFRGFSDFQSVFRRHVAGTGHFYSEQASQLRAVSGAQRDSLALFSRIARDERGNVQGMLDSLDAATVEAVAQRLATAQRVRVLGLRQSHSLASYLSYGLGMLRDDVSELSPEHGLAHGLGQLRGDDVLVVLGFAPYTRLTVTAARMAHELGVPVVAVTDGFASPLAGYAAHTFVSPTGGHFFSNSLAGVLVLLEGLMSVVAWQLGDSALRALEAREALISAMDVEL